MEPGIKRYVIIPVYIEFKKELKFDKYLVCLLKQNRIELCKCRTNNSKLPIVVGRYQRNIIPRHQRYCNICNENKMGDEYHLLFECANDLVKENRKISCQSLSLTDLICINVFLY